MLKMYNLPKYRHVFQNIFLVVYILKKKRITLHVAPRLIITSEPRPLNRAHRRILRQWAQVILWGHTGLNQGRKLFQKVFLIGEKIQSIRMLNNILYNLMIVCVLQVFQSFSMYKHGINDSKNLQDEMHRYHLFHRHADKNMS